MGFAAKVLARGRRRHPRCVVVDGGAKVLDDEIGVRFPDSLLCPETAATPDGTDHALVTVGFTSSNTATARAAAHSSSAKAPAA